MNVKLEYLHGVKWNGYGKTYRWKVLEAFEETLTDGTRITIPKGFRCDLTTSPRLLWGIFPPFGDNIRATIVHDWMYMTRYRKDEIGRYKAQKYADDAFYYLSSVYNPSHPIDNWIQYKTVRLLGWTLFK